MKVYSFEPTSKWSIFVIQSLPSSTDPAAKHQSDEKSGCGLGNVERLETSMVNQPVGETRFVKHAETQKEEALYKRRVSLGGLVVLGVHLKIREGLGEFVIRSGAVGFFSLSVTAVHQPHNFQCPYRCGDLASTKEKGG